MQGVAAGLGTYFLPYVRAPHPWVHCHMKAKLAWVTLTIFGQRIFVCSFICLRKTREQLIIKTARPNWERSTYIKSWSKKLQILNHSQWLRDKKKYMLLFWVYFHWTIGRGPSVKILIRQPTFLSYLYPHLCSWMTPGVFPKGNSNIIATSKAKEIFIH